MFRSHFHYRRSGGIVAAAAVVALSAVAAMVLKSTVDHRTEAAVEGEATARLARVHAALAALAKTDVERATLAGSLAPLRATLATLRLHDNATAVAATLKDAFASEPWWEPIRREFPITGVAFGTSRLDFVTDARAAGLSLADVIAQGAGEGSASAFVADGGVVWLATTQRVAVPGRERPAVLVLLRTVDASALTAILPTPLDAVGIESQGRVLVSAGAVQPVAALGGTAAPSAIRVVRRPLDALVLVVAADCTAVLSGARGVVTPAAVAALGGALAILLFVLSLRSRRPAGKQPTLDSPPVPASRRETAIDGGEGGTSALPGVPATLPLVHEGTQLMVATTEPAGLGVVGRYTLIDKLGEGGMAQVFTAVSYGVEGFQRKFVVKRLRAEFASNKAAIAQFIDEAKLASSLVHSNIIPVFDFGLAGDAYFMAMEYILGRDLGRLVERGMASGRGPLPIPMLLYAASETLKALDYAHARQGDDGRPLGLVHRDVSPSNILLSLRGEVKLFDFGIVKAEGRTSKTEHGMIKGNLSFMAPEQARCQATDARSDLFSLGLVMHFCATGKTLYQGESSYELLLKAASGPDAVDWPGIMALPAPLPAILHVALQPDPSARFPSAAAFAEALAPYPHASSQEAAAYVQSLVGEDLADEASRLTQSKSNLSREKVFANEDRSKGAGGT
jgi:serine/threonine protein kinase